MIYYYNDINILILNCWLTGHNWKVVKNDIYNKKTPKNWMSEDEILLKHFFIKQI